MLWYDKLWNSSINLLKIFAFLGGIISKRFGDISKKSQKAEKEATTETQEQKSPAKWLKNDRLRQIIRRRKQRKE